MTSDENWADVAKELSIQVILGLTDPFVKSAITAKVKESAVENLFQLKYTIDFTDSERALLIKYEPPRIERAVENAFRRDPRVLSIQAEIKQYDFLSREYTEFTYIGYSLRGVFRINTSPSPA